VISVDDCFLPQNIMLPLSSCMLNGLHMFFIGGISVNNIKECLTMIGHRMSMLSEDCTDSIVEGIYLNIECFL
jgi:hypothetical protein